ncbi:hypothetical protein ALFP_2357 [Alcaligenes faecalis]|uniref:hypothetical protein n=1 Tax=Alcaligenes faecalis TaxID=511 RepID=UPI0007C438CE|nr:hypothetical protein [Alcaligenes faecalis]ARP54244.1 hypothetical protein ALFP_2357 [Alcaligenes faecalis]
MNRRVTFKTLWLVSEVEQKAKKQIFSPEKTILYGPNGTGKSRITKNLFWTLGCSPQKHMAGGWDPDTIGALEFKFQEKIYWIIRQNKHLGLFDESKSLLKFADNMGSWNRAIAQFFNYHLTLQRPNSSTQGQAGIDYLTLPFYIDQDGSWGASWDTFTSLGQFKDWKKSVFESFIGLRPNAYFSSRQKWQLVNTELLQKQTNMEVQKTAFKKVRNILPKDIPALTEEKFEFELNDLAKKTKTLQNQQSELRAKVIVAVNLKERINSELQLMAAAHKNLTEDLGFLSDFDEEKGVECPTCGTVHKNSFHARLQLTQDAQSLSILIKELKKEREKAIAQHESLIQKLAEVNTEIQKFNSSIKEEQASMQAKDLLLAAHSVKTLDLAFASVTAELAEEIEALEKEEKKLLEEYKKFEDRARLKEVGGYYSDNVKSLSVRLHIPAEEQIGKAKPGNRGDVGGSSGPRSLLAIHLAMLRSNAKYGDTPFFPFVVDTPQQSGQDLYNLSSMFEMVEISAGADHQVILAVEMIPEEANISGFKKVDLTEKRALLNQNDFKEAAFLAEPLRAIKDALASSKETKKS